MTAVDWGILAFAALLAIWGYGQGILVSAFSLGGFIGGAYLGSRLVPTFLPQGSESAYAPLVSLVLALALGAAAAALMEGIGTALRGVLARGPLAALDSLGGAAMAAALGLGIAWILGAVALHTPQLQSLRQTVQRSSVLRELNKRLPPSGPILEALARVDPFPSISGPSADVAAPDAAILRAAAVEQASRSVVRVLGTACGLGVQGSGWAAASGLVVTNAHVVAGTNDTVVEAAGSARQLDATAVKFDSKNDLALLRVPGLNLAALAIDPDAKAGTEVAILGYPENGPFDAEPGRLGETRSVISRDAYGRGPVNRRITALRGTVRHGNSGGPAVDSDGEVVTTIFAAAKDGKTGYGVPDTTVQRAIASTGTRPVSTGSCTP